MTTKKKVLTAHEKQVELAKAAAPQYGIYIDGGTTEGLQAVVDTAGALILQIIESESEEKTKRQALSLLKDAFPGITNISNVSLNMTK